MKRKKIVILAGFFIALFIVFTDAEAEVGEYYSIIEKALDEANLPAAAPEISQAKVSPSTPRESAQFEPGRVLYPQTMDPVRKSSRPSRTLSDGQIILDVLDLKEMEIADVLKLISKKSGLNIVAGKNIKGKITIYLKDVDVRDALRIILESNDMAYIEEDGIIKVMTGKDYELMYGKKFGDKTKIKIVQLHHANVSDVIAILNQMRSIIGKIIADQKSNTLVLMDTADKLASMSMLLREIDVPISTKVFHLSYAKAEDIASQVGEVLTGNVGSLKFDQRSNKIIVTDTPAKLKQVAEMIKAFDEKQKEVSIEAKIVQIVLSDQFKMGIDWEAIVSDYHTLNLQSDFDVLGGSSTGTDKRGKLSIGTLSSDDYTVLLEALDSIGTTNILSSPRITVVNNEEAKILVGSTEPYVTTTTTTPASGATTTAESVNFIDVGVKLFVTPTIHNDHFITMKVKPEVSSVTRFLTTSQSNTIPVVETSEAETTVMVKDGVTLVIGGLIKDEKIESVKKVPVLGDIPILGFAFRNRSDLVRKTELVIFLTPRIISGDAQDRKNLGFRF